MDRGESRIVGGVKGEGRARRESKGRTEINGMRRQGMYWYEQVCIARGRGEDQKIFQKRDTDVMKEWVSFKMRTMTAGEMP